jgi:hypothetical protein
MKTIWGVLIIISFAFVMFGGLYNVLQQAQVSNTALSDSSNEFIAKYNNEYGKNLSNFNSLSQPDLDLSSNSTNQVDPFYRAQAEDKSNLDKFSEAIDYAYAVPSLIFLTIPFIELSDSSLQIYLGLVWLLISFVIILIFYKALRTGKVDNE